MHIPLYRPCSVALVFLFVCLFVCPFFVLFPSVHVSRFLVRSSPAAAFGRYKLFRMTDETTDRKAKCKDSCAVDAKISVFSLGLGYLQIVLRKLPPEIRKSGLIAMRNISSSTTQAQKTRQRAFCGSSHQSSGCLRRVRRVIYSASSAPVLRVPRFFFFFHLLERSWSHMGGGGFTL